jgi:glycosyltransferase involved in cell wall biosynthesis
MPELPLISVALCTYDGERFLPQQLDSVLAQDYPRLEVVAVDDASGDGTWALLQDLAARDPRVRIHRNPTNLGFQRNFERALGLCRGELIAPCDQDDVWRPDKLGALQRAMRGAAAAYCDSEIIDDSGRPLGARLSSRFHMGRIDDPAAFLFSNCVSGHALLLRRSLLEEALPLPEGVFHDWWLAFVAACSGFIEYRGEPLVQYRQHARAVTDLGGRRRLRASERPRGYKLPGIDDTERRLRAFAAYPRSRDPAFIAAVLRLWLGWKEQLVCPRLVAFLLRHRDRLFAFQHPGGLRRARRAAELFWGLRLKRLVRPHAFGRPSSPGAQAP